MQAKSIAMCAIFAFYAAASAVIADEPEAIEEPDWAAMDKDTLVESCAVNCGGACRC